MQSKGFIVALSAFFVLFVSSFGCGIGIAAYWTALVIALTIRVRKSAGWSSVSDWANTAFALGLAALPAIVTNGLAVSIGSLTLVCYLIILLLRCGAPGCDITPGSLPGLLGGLLRQTFNGVASRFGDSVTFRTVRIGRKVLCGLCISIVPLMLFHSLLASANDSYRHAVTAVVLWIFNREILERGFQIWVHYLILSSLLSFSLPDSEYPPMEVKREEMVTISIVPLLGLLAIFSVFQGTAVAGTFDIETFKELSLYVQQGFWQLLFASALGFGFWLVVHRRGKDVSKFLTVPQVLHTFSLLLLCLSLFTAHKVGLLQWSFGFKDQRLYATLAVSLLVMLSGFGALIVRGSIGASTAQRFFTTITLGSVCALGWLNIDRLAATANPIRYYVDEKPVRDLSYLLGNSYDNVASWKELMTEGISGGIKVDPTYYWGKYLPLCRLDWQQTPVVYLEQQNRRLIEKYSSEITSLRQLGAMNLREFYAYSWLLQNRPLTERFYEAARASC